eukprot:766873-Hanusia_phi.AAC.2
MVYRGESFSREKFVLYLADSIEPLTKAEAYMNDAQFVSELRQIVGDLQSVHCLSSEDVVILGSKGCIAAGPRCKTNEELLSRFMVLGARDNFVKSVFVRLKVLNSELLHIRDLLIKHNEHPNRGNVIREKLADTSRDISLLKELQQYLVESLQGFRVPPLPAELSGRKMYSFLDLHSRLKDAMLRARDLHKLIEGAENEYRTLVKMMDVVGKSSLEQVVKFTKQNTQDLVQNSLTEARNAQGMQMVNIMMAGNFIFALIDKAVGGVENWNGSYDKEWLIMLDRNFPLLIFGFHVFAFILWSWLLTSLLNHLAAEADGYLNWRLKMNRKIDPKAMTAWASTKILISSSVDIDRTVRPARKMRKAYWEEPSHSRWKGPAPLLEIFYDETNGFLLQVVFSYQKTKYATPPAPAPAPALRPASVAPIGPPCLPAPAPIALVHQIPLVLPADLTVGRSELTQPELLNLFQDDLVANRILKSEDRLLLPEFDADAIAEID